MYTKPRCCYLSPGLRDLRQRGDLSDREGGEASHIALLERLHVLHGLAGALIHPLYVAFRRGPHHQVRGYAHQWRVADHER